MSPRKDIEEAMKAFLKCQGKVAKVLFYLCTLALELSVVQGAQVTLVTPAVYLHLIVNYDFSYFFKQTPK